MSQTKLTIENKTGERGSLSQLLFEKGVVPKNQTFPVITSNTEEVDKLEEEITALKLQLTNKEQELDAHKCTIDSLFTQGVELLKSEQLFEAAVFFNALLIFNPDNLKALNNLAVIYFEMDMTEKAQETLKSILKIDPDNKLARENLGELD